MCALIGWVEGGSRVGFEVQPPPRGQSWVVPYELAKSFTMRGNNKRNKKSFDDTLSEYWEEILSYKNVENIGNFGKFEEFWA